MRQKRIKYVTLDLLKEHGVITEVKNLEIPKNKKIFLEIGSGKGQFITSLAKDHPDDFFIAMEINKYVIYRILEKKLELGLENLMIVLGDAKDLETYLLNHKIDQLFLNFSDPWPKTKHHKRRLTFPSFLRLYLKVLKPDAILQFRTDHLNLFLDSLEYMETYFDIMDVTYDLEPSTYMTEYEEKKRALGPIYQLKGKVKQDDSKDI